MSSPPSLPQEVTQPHIQPLLRTIFRSRWTFAILQVLDLLTTLAAFHVGGFEASPLVARLTARFGGFRGVLLSKLMALMIALGVRRLIWVVNLFYIGVVCWNVLVLILLSARWR